jgi:hypothetical protein
VVDRGSTASHPSSLAVCGGQGSVMLGWESGLPSLGVSSPVNISGNVSSVADWCSLPMSSCSCTAPIDLSVFLRCSHLIRITPVLTHSPTPRGCDGLE